MYTFYFDQGTTNSRGYLLKDGRIIATQKAVPSLGSKDVSETGDYDMLPRGLYKLYCDILDSKGVKDEEIVEIYASGMITSPYGLYEVPHLCTPFGPKEMAENIYTHFEDKYFHRNIHLILGAKTAQGHVTLEEIPTVNNIRGEEVESMGIFDLLPEEWKSQKTIVLFPGSHTHALLLEDGRLIDMLSNFSGEVFHAITTSTILAGSTRLSDEELKLPPDMEAVEMGINSLINFGFARATYTVHATKIFDACSNKVRRDMLSAIINGTVLQSLDLNIKNKWQDVKNLVIYGDATATAICEAAAKHFTPYLNIRTMDNSKQEVPCSVLGMQKIIKYFNK